MHLLNRAMVARSVTRSGQGGSGEIKNEASRVLKSTGIRARGSDSSLPCTSLFQPSKVWVFPMGRAVSEGSG